MIAVVEDDDNTVQKAGPGTVSGQAMTHGGGRPVVVLKKQGMGVPHLRCRLMHQSERPSTMGAMRLRAALGTHCTWSMASMAAALKPSTCRPQKLSSRLPQCNHRSKFLYCQAQFRLILIACSADWHWWPNYKDRRGVGHDQVNPDMGHAF